MNGGEYHHQHQKKPETGANTEVDEERRGDDNKKSPAKDGSDGNGAESRGITDPTGRFERTNEVLGRGASKEVYKAFDHEEGVEVAWNHLKVDHLSEQTAAKILSEIQILTQLDNENIIKFYHSWLHPNPSAGSGGTNYDVFFITELMTSGTLKNYLQKTKGPIKLKVLKNWCRQILKALLYLHSKDPPIIHRDLKCDNIFINGNNGQAKLGDFGLAVLKSREMLNSVLGTPEFMAPELYEENYDEKIDVYAFGMCLLEMVTKDYPYSECENAAQIFRRVTTGVKPQALGRITDLEVLNFIELCIHANPKERPSVQELLEHEFMTTIDEISGKTSSGLPSEHIVSGSAMNTTHVTSHNSHLSASSTMSSPPVTENHMHYPQAMTINSALATSPISSSMEEATFMIPATPFTPSHPRGSTPSDGATKLVSCVVEIIAVDWPVLQLKMHLQMSAASASKEVKFPFNLQQDTVAAVLDEMIREGVLEENARVIGNSALEDCLREPIGGQPQRTTSIVNSRPIEVSSSSSHTGVQGCGVEPSSLAGNGETGGITVINGCPLTATGGGSLPLNSGSIPLNQTSTLGPPYEMIEDAAVQDHPEVAALLLRQKKEIELLALFHRREHQDLLKNLKKQLSSTRTRIDSSSSIRTGTIIQGAEETGLPLPDGGDKQFMTKVRRLLYESTGNAAWLSDQPQAVGIGENGSV